MFTSELVISILVGLLIGAIAGLIALRSNRQNANWKWFYNVLIGLGVAILVWALLFYGMMPWMNKLAEEAGARPEPTTEPVNGSPTLTSGMVELKCGDKVFSLVPPTPPYIGYVCDANGQPAYVSVATPLVVPSPESLAQPTASGLFGSGKCDINGTTYNLMADSSAVWMDSESQKALASYGGTCNVTTVKEGWYWSVGDGTIVHDSVQMERGNAFNATPGNWTFTYDAPATGTTNESLGLTFRDNFPKTDESGNAFGTGICTVNGANYALAYDSTAVWQSDELLKQLWQNGGSCTVTTTRSGWYWSTTGQISLDGQPMANGQRLVAPAGTYVFTYEGATDANGFTIRDNVPFGQ